MTALHWAAFHDDQTLAQLLLAAKADVAATTRVGAITPLSLAARNGSAAMIEALVAAKADVKHRDDDWRDAADGGRHVRERRCGPGVARPRRVRERPRDRERADGADVRRLGEPGRRDQAACRAWGAHGADVVGRVDKPADDRRRRQPGGGEAAACSRCQLGDGWNDRVAVRGAGRAPGGGARARGERRQHRPGGWWRWLDPDGHRDRQRALHAWRSICSMPVPTRFWPTSTG